MHFTRFQAMYLIKNLPPTPVRTLERCREIAMSEGIRYAYIGNVPGHKWENTYCHNCGRLIIQRGGFFTVANNLKNGKCPYCSSKIPGVWV
jgi:pyruvate formate lyase activating enzyme